MKKRLVGIILVMTIAMTIAMTIFAGCESNERDERRDDSWATNTYEEAVLYEDVITEEIIVESFA